MPFPDDLLTLALEHFSAGRFGEAESCFWSVLASQPAHAEALRMLGHVARKRGDIEQATDYFNRSLLCDRSNPETWKNLGDARLAARDYVASIANFEEAIALRPDFEDAYNNLGVALQNLGESERASRCFQEAIRLNPKCVEAYNNLGNALARMSRIKDATKAFQEGLRLDPNKPELAYNLGTSLHEQNKVEEAAVYYRQALRLKPNYPDASNNLATALKELGHLDEAIAQYRETLKLLPFHALTHYNLSELVATGNYRFPPQELETLKAFMASGRCPPLALSLFHFTLATVCHKKGDYDEAFGHYEQANRLRKKFLEDRNQGYNPQKQEAMIDRVSATYTTEHFQQVKDWGLDSELPVFIIGMPRSGSTLVEQILASHPRVYGAGELGEIPRFIANMAEQTKCEPYTTSVLPTREAAQGFATEYLAHIADLGEGADRVTIKTLENFQHLGLIATLFPRARVIHCRRDPLDVCLSCYFQNFHELNFAWSLEDIAAYYRSYERAMAHWAKHLPLQVYEVRYEDLVHNQSKISRELVSFLGLEWDGRCLSFFRSHRPVRTASTVQVRKPMTAQAIGRWKHYEAHLGPLFQGLGRAAAREGETSQDYISESDRDDARSPSYTR